MTLDRAHQAFRKMRPGTIGGQSRIATPPAIKRSGNLIVSTAAGLTPPTTPLVCSLGTPELLFNADDNFIIWGDVQPTPSDTLYIFVQEPITTPFFEDSRIEEWSTSGTYLGDVAVYPSVPHTRNYHVDPNTGDLYHMQSDYPGFPNQSNTSLYKNGSLLYNFGSRYIRFGNSIAVDPNDGTVWLTDDTQSGNSQVWSVPAGGGSTSGPFLVDGPGHDPVKIIWHDDRFYISCGPGTHYHSYEPGVGAEESENLTFVVGTGGTGALAWSQTMERLVFSVDGDNLASHPPMVSSLEATLEVLLSEFPDGGGLSPHTITGLCFIDDYAYVTVGHSISGDPAYERFLYRIPIECA